MLDRKHGGDIWAHINSSKKRIIDFSANINPLGLAPKTKEAILRNLNKIEHYPEAESQSLRKILSAFHRVPEENILIGNGSIELIYLIPQVLKPKRVLIPAPSFSEYEFASRAAKAKTIFIRSSQDLGFRIDVLNFKKIISKKDLIFLCNPNNPTGTCLLRKEILSLLDICRNNNSTLAIDEAFMDFVPDAKRFSFLAEAKRNKNLLVIRSLTKFFSLPGLRLGYLIGQKQNVDKLKSAQFPWNVNVLAQIAARELLADKEYINKTRKIILEEKSYLFKALASFKGVKVYPSQANFLLCGLEGAKIKSAQDLSDRLLKKGILVRNCANFRGLNNRFFRLAIRQRKDNRKLILAMKDILK